MKFLKGLASALLFALNTLFWCVLLYPFALVKIIPFTPLRQLCDSIMIGVAQNWISCNSWGLDTIHSIKWNVTGLENLKYDRSYLVSANHQSWVDIVVLQKVLNRRIPFLRFFLKQELIFVPLLGIAWWALDFPFMRRYSKTYLAKHPEKRGKDLETTRKACERFRGKRISILNFLEGTRFTPAKHTQQNSPYKNLLRPKTGGIAFVIEAMGSQFHSLLDVTLKYPQGAVTLWGLFTGELTEISFHVEEITIPKEFLNGNYLEDPLFRQKLQAWIHEIWARKDERLSLNPRSF